ncbi:MAG TPA: ABC transporter ATP-binding protein [Gaiellaceae bacterium]|nr:ABC transporter ATP-binding protein [Gaiellaceae bacterium]
MSAERHLLEVDELSVSFDTDDGTVRAVEGVSFSLEKGEILCIVGESGSGKSVMTSSLIGLTRAENASIRGRALFDGVELIGASERELERIRGAAISVIPQDPMTALDPVLRVGIQIEEQIRAHRDVSKREAAARAVALMERVGIPQARTRARSFVHQFSGGMRQRIMIAMALSCDPRLIIADEPTTALDVTIQAQILHELAALCRETGTALILVTHDFGVVAELADRVAVMYGGRIIEQARVTELFHDPQHPYTWGLLGSVPRVDRPRAARLPTIAGAPPSLLRPPTGCHFKPRCPHRFERCDDVPLLVSRLPDQPEHRDRCWLTIEEKRRLRAGDGDIRLGEKVVA